MTSASDTPVIVIKITRALAIRLAVYGATLFALGLLAVAILLGKYKYILHHDSAWLLSGLKFIAVYFVTLALHEAVHGFFFWVFGGHPKFGAGLAARFLPYFYATSPGDPFTLFQMTVIGLAPFVILSIASLGMMLLTPALAAIAATAFVTNFSGAVGDLWFCAQIFRFRRCRDLRMIDLESGIAVYSSDPSANEIAERVPIERAGPLGRLLLRWIVATVILFTSITPMVLVLELTQRPSTTIGPSWFPLFSVILAEGGGFDVFFSGRDILVTGLLLALLFLPFDLQRRKPRRDTGTGASPHPAFL